jgi:surfeit locus 1 family protein
VRLRWPGWPLTAAAVAGLVLTLSAAHWQFNRAVYKSELAARYAARQAQPPILVGRDGEPRDMAYRRIEAFGEFDALRAVLVDNRVRAGRAGFEVIMPLKLANGAGFLLVNRGWVAASGDRRSLPRVMTPAGVVRVAGTAVIPSEHPYELSYQTVQGRVWQNFTLSRYRAAYDIAVRDYLVRQENDIGDGLARDWSAPGFGIQRHRAYAAQWLIFAALIVVFYVYFGCVRARASQ